MNTNAIKIQTKISIALHFGCIDPHPNKNSGTLIFQLHRPIQFVSTKWRTN